MFPCSYIKICIDVYIATNTTTIFFFHSFAVYGYILDFSYILHIYLKYLLIGIIETINWVDGQTRSTAHAFFFHPFKRNFKRED